MRRPFSLWRRVFNAHDWGISFGDHRQVIHKEDNALDVRSWHLAAAVTLRWACLLLEVERSSSFLWQPSQFEKMVMVCHEPTIRNRYSLLCRAVTVRDLLCGPHLEFGWSDNICRCF